MKNTVTLQQLSPLAANIDCVAASEKDSRSLYTWANTNKQYSHHPPAQNKASGLQRFPKFRISSSGGLGECQKWLKNMPKFKSDTMLGGNTMP